MIQLNDLNVVGEGTVPPARDVAGEHELSVREGRGNEEEKEKQGERHGCRKNGEEAGGGVKRWVES